MNKIFIKLIRRENCQVFYKGQEVNTDLIEIHSKKVGFCYECPNEVIGFWQRHDIWELKHKISGEVIGLLSKKEDKMVFCINCI